jgi:alpha-beta hydrolase superfamily lysophospholipase
LISFRLQLRLRRWLITTAVAVAVWLLVSSVVAFRLTRRPRSRFEEPAPNVTWGKLESHRFSTRDGEEIGAWFVDGRGGAPSVLWIHGNGGNRSHGLDRAKLLASQGYAVLMISLRCHGDSTGDYHDVGYSARLDVEAAVSFLEGRRPGRPVIVIGNSMGSAAAIFAAGELGNRVHGYVLESPYQDLKVAVWNRTDAYLPPVLREIAYSGLRVVGPIFLPHLEQISPLKAITGVPRSVPVLILAGGADRLARPAEAKSLYNQVAAHGWLVFIPGAGHGNLFRSAPELYARTVLDFCSDISRSVTAPRLRLLPAGGSARDAGCRGSVVRAIAAYCSLLQFLGRVSLPSRRARHNRQRNLGMADGAKFAPRRMRSLVSSRPGNSRRA